MEPMSALAIAGAITTVINNVAVQIMAIKQLHDQIKNADAHLLSIISQLNSLNAALRQIRELIQTADYDEQLISDLALSLQACQLHMDLIDSKVAKMKTKNGSSALKFRGRLRVVFESDSMGDCIVKLNNQAIALNLLITVLTSKSVTEQKAMLQRSGTRKVFRQIQEDKKSLLDETASVDVLRDQESVIDAAVRWKNEPVIAKAPWKRFGFDHEMLGSKAYGGKLFRRKSSEKDILITSEPIDVESENVVDDAATLVEDLDSRRADSDPIFDEAMYEDKCSKLDPGPPRFSRMLAFAHTDYDVPNLVRHAQELWNIDNGTPQKPSSRPLLSRNPSSSHRLNTRYFDLSIHSHTLDGNRSYRPTDELLASYKDVSSILFTIKLSAYFYCNRNLSDDFEFFSLVANDYNLWLAKIILFLDTTDLDLYSAHAVSEDVLAKFMQAGRTGASEDRISVVVGEADEMAAGRIFAVSNETGREQAEKWAGLSTWDTE